MRILFVTATICSIWIAPVAHSQDVPTLIRKADELDARERTDNAKDRSQKLAFAKLCMEYAKKAVHVAPDNADAHVCLSVAYGKMTDFVDNKTKMEYSKVVKSEGEGHPAESKE